MVLLKECRTCEFNFSGICAGHGSTYKYGEAILDDTKGCENWSAGLEYFTEITTNAPWYIKEPYNEFKIDYPEFLKLIEADTAGQAIEVNIFDAIRKIYGLSLVDLAVILNVSFGVMYRARSMGVPAKRLLSFSQNLCIPISLFQTTTTYDFAELKKCKDAFENSVNTHAFVHNTPSWKQKLIGEITSYLHCPIHIAREIARVDKINWKKGGTDILNVSEKILIDYISMTGKKSRQYLTSIEYSLDIACHPHVHVSFHNDK